MFFAHKNICVESLIHPNWWLNDTHFMPFYSDINPQMNAWFSSLVVLCARMNVFVGRDAYFIDKFQSKQAHQLNCVLRNESQNTQYRSKTSGDGERASAC